MSEPTPAQIIAHWQLRQQYTFNRYFPNCVTGVCVAGSLDKRDHAGLCRALYPRPVQFMAAGAVHRERMYLAANRIGKTATAAYEIAAHLTGEYPKWWTGKTYDRAIRAWAAGDTMLSTRDILQVALLGPVQNLDTETWTGMIYPHAIMGFTRKSGGIAKCVDQVHVAHVAGGQSVLEFKSFDQGRRLFQGTEQEVIWLDEEPPEDVYAECLTRTMTTSGLILCTFTPLQGLTPFLQQYLETAQMPDQAGALQPAYGVFFPDGAAA